MPKEMTIRDIELEFERLHLEFPHFAGEFSLLDELQDPGATLGYGDLARLGAALTAMGRILDTAARECVMGGGSHTDSDVRFAWRNPTTKVDDDQFRRIYPSEEHPQFYKAPAVETAKVKKEFPEKSNPGLYKPDRKGYVQAELPE